MSGTEPTSPSATAAPAAFGDNKGIRFTVKTGGKSWECTLQDRAAYDRKKASRTTSTDSVETTSSTATAGSKHSA